MTEKDKKLIKIEVLISCIMIAWCIYKIIIYENQF